MASPPVVTPCSCSTYNYDLGKTDPTDRRIVAEYLRRLADRVEDGEIKNLSFHVAEAKR